MRQVDTTNMEVISFFFFILIFVLIFNMVFIIVSYVFGFRYSKYE